MNSALGVVGGLVAGAAIGFGAASLQKARQGGGLVGDETPVVEVDGVKFKEADLPADIRSSLYEVKAEAFERISGVVGQFALQMSLAKEKDKNAKADNLPPFDQLVAAPTPSEADLKTLFEANKTRLPPNTTFEQIRPEIERFVKNQQLGEVLRQKSDELKQKNRIAVLLPAPVAPKVSFDVTPYAAKGSSSQATLLVEVADYLCPHCQATQPEVEALVKDSADKVRFVAVPYSLRPEGLSGTLARGAYCAKEQGDEAFWKYHATAFETAKAKGWKASDPDRKEVVLEIGGAVGLDKSKFEPCLDSAAAKSFVQNTEAAFHKAGVTGTPTFFLNGRKLSLGNKALRDAVTAGVARSSH